MEKIIKVKCILFMEVVLLYTYTSLVYTLSLYFFNRRVSEPSYHFKDENKQNGPEVLEHRKNAFVNLNFVSFEKKTRNRLAEEHQR